MGRQGPLAAQALGRSPYEDLVEGEGEEDARQPTQFYDSRGRPYNPETKRINRDLIRSHNEVMLVIGVAESDSPVNNSAAESEEQRQTQELEIGTNILDVGLYALRNVGAFGVDGLRQRIMVFKRFSLIPFWRLFWKGSTTISITRDILPGLPLTLLSEAKDRAENHLLNTFCSRRRITKYIRYTSAYLDAHFDLYIILQHLGLSSSPYLLPPLKFFIPFTSESPIQCLPLPTKWDWPSLGLYIGKSTLLMAPFFTWIAARSWIGELRCKIHIQVLTRVPSTRVWIPRRAVQQTKAQTRSASPPLPRPPSPPPIASAVPAPTDEAVARNESVNEESNFPGRHNLMNEPNPADATHGNRQHIASLRRHSTFSTMRGDEDASDEDEREEINPTLISFDVEASDAADAPSGLWSAELRPSAGPEPRPPIPDSITYADTDLTSLPAFVGAHLLSSSVTRLIAAPFEAVTLRWLVTTFCAHRGLSMLDLNDLNLFLDLNTTSILNFLGTELLHFSLGLEVWAACTLLSQWFHLSQEEWQELEELKKSALRSSE